MDIDKIVSELTLPEKASLLIGGDFWHTAAIERLGVPAIMMSDGPHGMRTQLSQGDHVGTGGSEPATCFPTASNLHAAWDPELNRRVGAALAAEADALGVAVVLGPGVNIKRSPLCGRNFEYISEDPYLAGVLGAAMVEGVQSGGIGTSVKHFAANNQETDRLRVNAIVDERTLREIYLPAFERVVKTAQPWTVMCSYNTLNGVRVSENHWLLTEVLRDEWGFEGLVVSDWGAVGDRPAAVAAGLDLEMPPAKGLSDAAVVAAVESGDLPIEAVDACVRRVLELVERGGHVRRQPDSIDLDAHHALAREAAAQGIVLLKNAQVGGEPVLPLRPDARVAVIGEFARTTRFQGGGSSQVNATRVESALDAFADAYPDVDFAPGFLLDGPDDGLLDEAVAAARNADVAVVFLGLTDAEESEGFDRSHMELPAHQLALLYAVVRANPATVVVLSNGSAVTMRPWDADPAAVVEAWLGGQAVGGAVVDVLTGKVNPAGRLCETLPLRLEDSPAYGNFPGDSGSVRYGEGLLVGYRGFDYASKEVAYPFGYGLSYTTFELGGLSVEPSGSAASGDLAVSVGVDVTNVGERAGAEVVQVYVADPEASVLRPKRELRGFAKVFLEPGETRRVEVTLDQRAFSFWSGLTRTWVVEGGDFVIEVGPHSRELQLTETIAVDAPRVAAPIDFTSTAQEWAADAEAMAILRRHCGVPDDVEPGLFADADLMTLIGNFPLERLASAFEIEPSYEHVSAALAEVQAVRGA